jgi:hypothetical protein
MTESTPETVRSVGNFLEITRDLLKNRPKWMSHAKIYEETGLTEAWLTSFASKRVNDPGASKVQKLYDYLIQTKQKLA